MKESIVESYSRIATGKIRSCECDGGDVPAGTRADRAPVREMDLGCGAPLEHAAISAGMTVLDLGSGSGRELFVASRLVGETGRAIGIDMTASMVDLARNNARLLGITNTEFHRAEIEQMPLDSGSVDRIISNCVLNLVPDKDRAFREMFRVLKPGGRFAVADIVATKELPEGVRSDPKLWCSCVGGAIPVGRYLEGLRGAGFRDVAIVSQREDAKEGNADLGLLSITVTGRK